LHHDGSKAILAVVMMVLFVVMMVLLMVMKELLMVMMMALMMMDALEIVASEQHVLLKVYERRNRLENLDKHPKCHFLFVWLAVISDGSICPLFRQWDLAKDCLRYAADIGREDLVLRDFFVDSRLMGCCLNGLVAYFQWNSRPVRISSFVCKALLHENIERNDSTIAFVEWSVFLGLLLGEGGS
jgi:hypothetical protein